MTHQVLLVRQALVDNHLYVFYEPPEGEPIEVDIVFVHGLALGSPRQSWWKTWTSDEVHRKVRK